MKRLLFLGLLIMMGCQNTPKPTSELRLTFLTDVNSLDPRYGYEIPANFAIKMLYEGLLRTDLDGGIVPGIAESYHLSEDEKTYTFFLRDTRWTDGTPVTAMHFAKSWCDIIDPNQPTQGTSDFYPIKNVEKIVKGEATLDSVGIHVRDDKTLVVELEHPTPYFPQLLTTSVYCPTHGRFTNGPFSLTEWRKADALIFTKNPRYWNAANVKLDRIHAAIVEDPMTQLALFEKGESDWYGKPFTKLPLDAVPSLRAQNQLELFPERAVYWYFLNTEKFPLNNAKIRKSLALAVSREEIVTHLLKEDEQSATSINREHAPCFTEDPHLALSLFEEGLTELGITRAKFPSLPLSYCNIETNHRLALTIQQQWEKALGVKVVLDPQEWTLYYANLSSGNTLIGGLSWHARVSDPLYNLQLFKLKDDRLNMSFWENPTYASLLDRALEDPAKRLTYLDEAETLLMEEMPIIPVYFLTISYAKSTALKDVYVSDINQLDFASAYFQ